MQDVLASVKKWIISDNPEDISDINTAEYNMACWKRNALGIDQCIDHILATSIESLDKKCFYGDAAELLSQHLSKAIDINETPDIDVLLSDVQHLANIFYAISKSKNIRLHFAVVENNMCRRFHTDINDLRLLCTYYGPGTVCLNNNEISEEILDKAVTQPDIIPSKYLYNISTNDVVVLKGALHYNSTKTGVLHRSPVLSESQNKRVILRLDTDKFLL